MRARTINEYNFERGLDPKEAMGIGLQSQFIKWMNKLRLGKGVGSINLKQLFVSGPCNLKLEIIYYGQPSIFSNHITQFPPKTFFKVDITHINPESWRRIANLWINPEYDNLIINCFDKEGYIKESVNFERGLDPKDAMNIGDVEGRKKEEEYVQALDNSYRLTGRYIDPKEFITSQNWHGDEVRLVGINSDRTLFGYNYYDNWDWQYSSWDRQGQETSIEETWMNINKSDAQEAYNRFENIKTRKLKKES